MEDYKVGAFQLNITIDVKNGAQSKCVTIANDVSKQLTPDNSMKGKDVAGIMVNEQIKTLIDWFKESYEDYLTRWKAIQKIRELQKEVYLMAGR